MITVENNTFSMNLGVLSAGTHELTMDGMYTQEDSNDHFHGHDYYFDLNGNEFYLTKPAHLKVVIDKAVILLKLEVKDVLIPETPVLNLYANWDNNYTIFIGNKYYQLEVVNGKGSMQLTGLDLGNYSVVAIRDADENFNLARNFTTFSISKTYSNFLVISTNVEYDTLAEAVANSGNEDTIYVKNGTYKDTKIEISNKTLDIIASNNVIFDAQGSDANFIIVNKNAEVHIYGITFRGIHNRNINYGAIVNHGYLSLDSCNFTDNKITKTSFAGNGGAAIFSDGELLEIDNCNFINNTAPLKVSTAAVTSLGHEDVSITDSKFINNTAREGGAVHFKNIAQFVPAIYSCDFEQNTAVKGSAIYIGNNSGYASVILSNFVKNNIINSLGEKAQLEGGVIYVNANTTEVTVEIGSSSFENNSNKDVDGGAICLDGSSNAYIEDCDFNNNSGKLGSAILIKNPNNKKLTFLVDGSTFTNNHATTGAVATSPKVTALFEECIFINNTGENRHIYSNGFTVAHDTVFDVKNADLKASTVPYGNNSIIRGTVDTGVNIYAVANLTVVGENVIAEVKDNKFSYNAGVLDYGKYTASLNNIVDMNNNTYVMDSMTVTFKVNRIGIELNVSVSNITYGETLKVVETLPSTALGTISYQLNGKEYTKDELESLKLNAGKYTVVATYNNEDFAPSSSTINFEVYKANPTISVADVEVEDNGTIIVNIQTNVPSIYTIEIGDYKTDKYVNDSRAVEIDKIFEPGTYTIKVTSQERVNYKSNSTEATLKVTKNLPVVTLSASNKVTSPNDAIVGVSAPENAVGNITYTVTDSNKNVVKTLTQSCRDDLILSDLDSGDYEISAVFEGDDLYYSTNNIKMTPLSIMRSASNVNILTDDEYNYPFRYQEDEDDTDYEFFETLEEAIDNAMLMGGIITVRGGTYYYEDGNAGIDIEGEVELTIRAFEGEEVIFDCQQAGHFLYLTYDTEVEVNEGVPPVPIVYNTEGPTITLENITVINGQADSDGGVIEMDAGSLTLMNCNFYNNTADWGGVIYIGSTTSDQDADVIAYNTTFINNTATYEGGAIYISEGLEQFVSASFYACTFLDNYQGEDDERTMNYFAGPDADEIVKKACIFNAKDTISWTMDKINQTITVIGATTDVFDSIVLMYFDHVPLYSIYNNGSQSFNVTFEDVMKGNYTIGIMNDHDLNTYIFKNATIEMKVPNFIISGEVYENLTDAIKAVNDTNCIIYANMNYHDEENLQIDIINKSFTLTNFRGRMVVFDGSSTNWFFTVAEGCDVVIENINFVDGGIKDHATIENYGSLTLKNCTFYSFENGTVIYNSGFLNITNAEFSLNSIDNAIVLNDAKLLIDSVEFTYNVINTNSVVYNNGTADIVSSNFTGNINNGNGGAIYNKKSLTINDTVFNENEGKDGGAVYNEGTLDVLNSNFEDNTANGYGGVIFNDGEVNIYNSSFNGGFSAKDGGAIYNNDTITVDNSTLVANTATDKGGAIYNNKSLKLTKSFFGINFAYEYANFYNTGDIEFSGNTFDFYDVILYVPDGEYGIPTTITGTLDPQFNMDLQLTLPGFVNNKDADVTITDGIFEYVVEILPKGAYDVILNEVIYDSNGNVYYGEAIRDRLIINKANVYINLTVDDIIIKNSDKGKPVLKINASKNGTFQLLFNNKLTTFNITGNQAEIDLDEVGEGNYSVMVIREGDENYKDAVNATTFTVSDYLGNFIVNSTGGKFDSIVEAIQNSAAEDIIYVMEGTYGGFGYAAGLISGKKLTIIALGDVVFNQSSTNSMFLNVTENSDVTICDAVFTGFNANFKPAVFLNRGNLTFDGCTFVNNTLVNDTSTSTFEAFIYNEGNLNIVDSEFYGNDLSIGDPLIFSESQQSNITINESTFKNNILSGIGCIIDVENANSVKVISTEFAENTLIDGSLIHVRHCSDVLISADFYNNTYQNGHVIYAWNNTNLNIENSTFIGNIAPHGYIIRLDENNQSIISKSIFTENTAQNVVFSEDNITLSISKSVFTANTIKNKGAIYIASMIDTSIDSCVFANNNADNYRNIYSVIADVKITNSVFDAVNVDYNVSDIDYRQNETINGTIDIGTNFGFTVNININNKVYSVKVTNNKFAHNLSNLTGGDYEVVLNEDDNNLNNFVFDKITKTFTVNRIDPGLKVTISNITQGEKLEINVTLANNDTGRISYILDGNYRNLYSRAQLENITLAHGNHVVAVAYTGTKNYIPVTNLVSVEVGKITPNITVSDAEANYGEDIKIDIKVDVADYYTVFIGDSYDDSVSSYINGIGTFTVPSKNFKPGKYEIKVYKIETDDYNEAYGYANLTVNKAAGIFNLSNDKIDYGENATISVEVPVNASGNIKYVIYDSDKNPVYNITLSCLEDLVVPDLSAGLYNVTGTYEGDSYYTDGSIINSGSIFVIGHADINVTVSNITYGENALVVVESNVDGEYLVYVGTEPNVVTVKNGIGDVSVSNLNVGSYAVNVTIVSDNYTGFNETVFEVVPKSVSVIVSVEDIFVDENAVVVVKGEVDGEYIVSIYDQNYTANVAGGEGSIDIGNLNLDKNILVSVTIADGNYTAYNTTTFNVNKHNTTIELDIVTDENNVTMTVTVNDTATGLVKFQVTGTEEYTLYVDVENGKAVLEDILDIGDYTVVATYMGDSRFNTNLTSEEFTIKGHIKKDTPITADADVVGNRVTLTVIVDGNATGFVEVKSGVTVSNIALENGEATLEITLPYGSYSLDVTYLGDENYNMNSTKCEFTLVEPSKENTTISLDVVSDENYVVMTVTVDESATGLVKFEVSGEEEYTLYADVIGGIAVLEDILETGDYRVVATYMGDVMFNTNITSEEFTVVGHIKKDTPITADADVVGNRVTLTVIVDENATGFVKLTVGGTVAYIEVEEGVAKITTTLVPNSYFADVTYLGDDNYNMNSTKLTFTVIDASKINTDIELNIASADDGSVILDVVLNEAATGLVKFYIISEETGEDSTMYVDVKDGSAELLVNGIASGNYTVVATYMGDSVFNTNATSGEFTVTNKEKPDTNITVDIPTGYKAGEPLNVTVSIPGATGNISAVVDGVETVVPLDENGKAVVTVDNLTAGEHSIVVIYPGDDNHKSAYKVVNIPVEVISSQFSDVVVNNVTITATLVNALGDAIGNAEIKYTIGNVTETTVTDADGAFTIVGVAGEKIVIKYAGGEAFMPTSISITLNEMKPIKSGSRFNITDGTGINTYTVDYNVGERGHTVAFRLTDDEGNPITNATVGFAYKTVYFNRTTDENGIVSIGISTQVSGEYLCALSYLGDDKHNATFVAFYFNIQPKPMKIVASAKTFKSSVKTKKYTITLKTGPYNSKDGKTYLKAGKKVTLKINGKTYTAKTNAKGKATFKITKLTKKGKFTAKITFAGDKTYKAVKKSVKITIK